MEHYLVTTGVADAVTITFEPTSDLYVNFDILHTDCLACPGGVEASDRPFIRAYNAPDPSQPAWDSTLFPGYPFENPANTKVFNVNNVFDFFWFFADTSLFRFSTLGASFGCCEWDLCTWQNFSFHAYNTEIRAPNAPPFTFGEQQWSFEGRVDGAEWTYGGPIADVESRVDFETINTLVIGMMGSTADPGNPDNGTRFDNIHIGSTGWNSHDFWYDDFEGVDPLAAYPFVSGDAHISTDTGCAPVPKNLQIRQKTPVKPRAAVAGHVGGGSDLPTIYIKFVGGENHFYSDCGCTDEISVPFGAYDGIVRGCGDCGGG